MTSDVEYHVHFTKLCPTQKIPTISMLICRKRKSKMVHKIYCLYDGKAEKELISNRAKNNSNKFR